VYEIAGETPHHHLVCLRCRQVQPLSHEAVKDLFAKIAAEQSFQVETDHLALFGYCAECRPTRSEKTQRPAPLKAVEPGGAAAAGNQRRSGKV
jgi:Fur family ferric uptake transcriptional regulator